MGTTESKGNHRHRHFQKNEIPIIHKCQYNQQSEIFNVRDKNLLKESNITIGTLFLLLKMCSIFFTKIYSFVNFESWLTWFNVKSFIFFTTISF